MDNQFCKTCGQANVPNANMCTKCGNALNQMGNNQAFQNQTAQKPKKNSKKMFWILGIVAVLLVFVVGALGITAIAGYLYFATQDRVVREYPVLPKRDKNPNDDQADKGDDEPLSDIKFPSTGGDDGLKNDKNKGASKITNAKLILFFSAKKAKVGDFLLEKVSTTDDKSSFPTRIAGVTAKYKKGSTKLIHTFAAYESKSALKTDFAAYKKKISNSSKRVAKTTPTSIAYAKGGLVYLAFHNPDGGFHEFSSRKFDDILKYHDNYFDIKNKTSK